MLPDRVSNPGPLTYESGALPTGLRGPHGLNIFDLLYPFSPLSPSLWETVRYRLKYCLKGPLNPKQSNPIQSNPWGGRVVQWSWVNFSAGASYNLDDSRARAYCVCSKCGLGLFGHFYSPLSFLSYSLSLGDGPI